MFSQDPVKGLFLRCATTVGMGVAGRHAAHGCKTWTRDDARVSAARMQHSPERHTQSLGGAAHPRKGARAGDMPPCLERPIQ